MLQRLNLTAPARNPPDSPAQAAATAEIVARVGGEQAAKRYQPSARAIFDGACALELRYAIGASNARDFDRIPGLRG